MKVKLGDLIEEYSERNIDNKYKPVAVGKYGIRARESIYSKELAKDYSKNKLIYKGTLTIGMGSNQIDIGILRDDEIYSVSPAYHTYNIKISNYDYLDYLLTANNNRMFSIYANRGSRQGKTLDLKRWLTDELRLHDEKDQKIIVQTLNAVKQLISQKEAELVKLDNLIKARFVEMFNSETKRELLQNLSIGKSGYGAASASVPYNPNRPRYIRITDINDDGTLNNDYVCSINKSDDGVFRLQKGDFLFARMGATVGKTYYYRGGNQIFAGYLIRFKLDLEKILPEYLYAYTQTEEYLDWVKLNQSGAAQPGINAQKYSSLQIPIADIAEQTEFVYFVKQIDKSKFVLSNELTMCDFHIRLIHDRVMHSCINLRVAQ